MTIVHPQTLEPWQPLGNQSKASVIEQRSSAFIVTPERSNAISKVDVEGHVAIAQNMAWRRTGHRMTVKEKYYSTQSPTSPRTAKPTPQDCSMLPTSRLSYSSQPDSNHNEGQEGAETASAPLHSQYLGEMTCMIHDTPSLPPDHQKTTAFSQSMNEQILEISGAASLPSEIFLNASADAYFQYAFHRLPVVDREDLLVNQPSVVLCQALCMIGSRFRHPKGPDPLAESGQYYAKAKTLIHVNHERDHINILKTLCLLMTWNITGPVILTFDCGWHWLGVATSLLHQMGLHREATCAKLARPGTARRIAWCIFTQDKLLSAAVGRPTTIKVHEFDVRPLIMEDFETSDTPALLFMALAKLASILGRILELHLRRAAHIQEESAAILESLKGWTHNLPESIRLHDRHGRRRYRRDVYEVHTVYFIIVITYLHLFGDQTSFSATSLASLVASSCITRLYQELYYRDDINYLLGINMWFLLVASVPQLLYNPTVGLYDQDQLCSEELDIIVAALEQLQTKVPGATAVLNAVNRLRASRSRVRVRSSTTLRASQDVNEIGEDHKMSALRDLFPFPSSFSPRLKLLDYSTQEMVLGTGALADFDDDLSWICDEYSELSYGLAFANGPQLFTQSY
ncbi:uncharacterized protein BP5553_06857 [Venustampulla echinocandica]|uniref:Xylanolytic transcriptional activator regulatory domain-containing protein n=1 Tax=Venustampulla echinocandica TaxID=2656787 RepID=A0A370TL54_9HELO|nr:uncharacterized protein BP5553_06857 [Venustampulla echinocandica]RDL36245.1 hypothetical protein BP5553_06857 [Venustampulla echinocandica]